MKAQAKIRQDTTPPRRRTPALLPALLILLFPVLVSPPLPARTPGEDTPVYLTATGTKYHRETCSSLRRSKIARPLGEAVRAGYEPCALCNPPVLPASALAPDAGKVGDLYQVQIAELRSVTQADLTRMTPAQVIAHVDGDTVRVRIAAPPPGLETVETSRMIGVDTPETVHPRRGREFFGAEASEFTRRRLLGTAVLLAFDWDRRDRYGRLLAYIYYPAGDCHNAALIREGYAHAYTSFSFQFADEFRALEQEARQAGRGLWAQDLPPATD
jgi:micrococcal nuclease